MSELFLAILNMSITACYVILAVILVRLILKRAPKSISCALWAVVLFRLLCPFSINSVLSLLPVRTQAIPSNIATMAEPQVNSGISVIDHAVNAVLPQATPLMSINPMQVVIAAAAFIWVLGVAVFLAYAVLTWLRLRTRLSGAENVEGNTFRAPNLATPFVFGIFRTRIYLPEGLTEKETAYILSHERMHIRRHDPLVKSIAFLALCIHWFNPFVWASFILLAKDMEMACDEAVLREMGPGIKKEYSSSLLSLATKHLIFNGTPLAFGEGEVKGRVKNILNYKKPAFWGVIAAIVVAAAAVAGLALNPDNPDAGDNTPVSPDSTTDPESAEYPEWLKTAWEWRTPYTGNASAVGNITDSWYTIYDAAKNGFELYTEEEPYGARIRYSINPDSDLDAGEIYDNYSSVLDTNVILLFSLVENLDYTELSFGENVVYTFKRDIYEELFGDLWSQSETLEDLQRLYEKIAYAQMNGDMPGPDITSIPEQQIGADSSSTPTQPLTENPDYQYLLTLFPDYSEPHYPDTPVEADLDGDGTMERIIAEDLRYNGGDGGCSISVSRLLDGKYTEIPFPDTFERDRFPVQMKWDGKQMQIIFTDNSYQTVPDKVLSSIYASYPITLEEALGRPMETQADAISDFTLLKKEDGTTALVLKQYITGPSGSHSDRAGYAITELILHQDNTWDVTQYYLPAN